MFYFLSIISFVFAFILLRTWFWIVLKNLDHISNLKDSVISWIYFWILSSFMQHSRFHPTDWAIIMFTGIFIVPLIYTFLKRKYFVKNMKDSISFGYFFQEFAIIFLGIFFGLAINQYLETFFTVGTSSM